MTKRPRRYAWSTGVQFPSSLRHNITRLAFGPNVPPRVVRKFTTILVGA